MTTNIIPMTPLIAGHISLDYVNSDSAAEIDKGIRETIKGIRLSILAMGMGLANIKTKRLYRSLNCDTMGQYIKRLCDDNKMDRSSLFRWLQAGEAYLKYQNELETVGFSDNDGPSKLIFLERALAVNQKHDVFDNIKNMSLREFISFAKGSTETEDNSENWEVTIKGNSVYINGKLGIIISKKMDRKAGTYFKKLIRMACDALEAEEVLLAVHVHNFGDIKRLYPRIEKLKKEMGIN